MTILAPENRDEGLSQQNVELVWEIQQKWTKGLLTTINKSRTYLNGTELVHQARKSLPPERFAQPWIVFRARLDDSHGTPPQTKGRTDVQRLQSLAAAVSLIGSLRRFSHCVESLAKT